MTMKTKITIYRDDVWAGEGWLDADGQIVDCPAVLGDDQDESDAVYAAIESAIEDGEDCVVVKDGTYTWLTDAS